MNQLQETGRSVYRVSPRGQFSLPAEARKRWGIENGGRVELFDLGRCIVMLPVEAGSARESIAQALSADDYRDHVAKVDDPELRDE